MSEKQFAPTPYHRRKMRERGRFAQSRDVVNSAILLAGTALFYFFGMYLFGLYTEGFREYYAASAWLEISPARFMEAWYFWVMMFFAGVFPILAAVSCVAAGASIFQSGFLFLPEKILPDWENLSPAKAAARIFSANSLVQLLFGVLKMVFLGGTAYWIISGDIFSFFELPMLEFSAAVEKGTRMLLLLAVKLSAVLFVLSLGDYAWQWWRFEQELKMTLEEMREEMKITEGNPETRKRVRERMNFRKS